MRTIVCSLVLLLLCACGGEDGPGRGNDFEGRWWEVLDSGDNDCIFFRLENGTMTRVLAGFDPVECPEIAYELTGTRLQVDAAPDGSLASFSCDVLFTESGRMLWSDLTGEDFEPGSEQLFERAEEASCGPVPSCGPQNGDVVGSYELEGLEDLPDGSYQLVPTLVVQNGQQRQVVSGQLTLEADYDFALSVAYGPGTQLRTESFEGTYSLLPAESGYSLQMDFACRFS